MRNGVAGDGDQAQPAQGLVHRDGIIEVEDVPEGGGAQQSDRVPADGEQDQGKNELAGLTEALGDGEAPGIEGEALVPEVRIGVAGGVHEETPEEAANDGRSQEGPGEDAPAHVPGAMGPEAHPPCVACSSHVQGWAAE